MSSRGPVDRGSTAKNPTLTCTDKRVDQKSTGPLPRSVHLGKRGNMSENKGSYVTADDLLNDRRDWLKVVAVEVEPNAFDIVLKIDGTYFDRDTAHEVAELFARDLRYLLERLDPDRFLVRPEAGR